MIDLLFVLTNLANVIFLIGYIVTDILWLRILTVVGSALSLWATLLLPDVQFSWIAWSIVYNVINLVQITLLFLSRRPVRLTAAEQHLYSLAFRSLTPRELKRLVSIARFDEAPAGARLIDEGARLDRLLVLLDGQVAVVVGGQRVATLGEGRFVGEMSFLTGAPTTARVDAVTPTRYVAFPVAALEKFLGKNPDLRAALQLIIGRDLVAKLSPTDGGGSDRHAIPA